MVSFLDFVKNLFSFVLSSNKSFNEFLFFDMIQRNYWPFVKVLVIRRLYIKRVLKFISIEPRMIQHLLHMKSTFLIITEET